MTTTDPIDIACELTLTDLSRQRERWHALAERALRSTTATEAGVRLEFDAGVATAHALLDLVATERGCCGWVAWTVTSTAAATVVDVSATGSGLDRGCQLVELAMRGLLTHLADCRCDAVADCVWLVAGCRSRP